MVTELMSSLGTGAVPLQNDAAGAIFGLVFFALYAVIIVASIAGMWKVFAKADEPGWGAIVPIYNTYLMIKIGGRPGWWLFLTFIPLINIIIFIIIAIDLADSFGKGAGYGLGLGFLPFIFYPLLGFGSATYQGGPKGGF